MVSPITINSPIGSVDLFACTIPQRNSAFNDEIYASLACLSGTLSGGIAGGLLSFRHITVPYFRDRTVSSTTVLDHTSLDVSCLSKRAIISGSFSALHRVDQLDPNQQDSEWLPQHAFTRQQRFLSPHPHS